MVQVKEPEKKNHLGVLNLPLSRLLNISDLTLDQYFLLEHSGANSQIKLKATLRVGKHTHTHPSVFLYKANVLCWFSHCLIHLCHK